MPLIKNIKALPPLQKLANRFGLFVLLFFLLYFLYFRFISDTRHSYPRIVFESVTTSILFTIFFEWTSLIALFNSRNAQQAKPGDKQAKSS